MEYLQPIFMIAAIVGGGIMAGVTLMQSKSSAKWNSPLGRKALIAVFLLVFGMFGWVACIIQKGPDEPKWGYHQQYQPTMVYTYGWGIRANGHVGWGMQWTLR